MYYKKSPLKRLIKDSWVRKREPRVLVVIDYENIKYLIKRLNISLSACKISMLIGLLKGGRVKKLFYAGIFPEIFPERQATLNSFGKSGFTRILKPVKFLRKVDGERVVKGDLDVNIAVDVMAHTLEGAENYPNYDLLLFFGGDGDYAPLFEMVLRGGLKQIIIFSGEWNLGKENRELIRKDKKDSIRYINIADIVTDIGEYNYKRSILE